MNSRTFLMVFMFLISVMPVMDRAFGEETPGLPQGFRIVDTPNDGGKSVTVLWNAASNDTPSVTYRVLISDTPEGPFTAVGDFPASRHFQRDVKAPWWARPTAKDHHRVDVPSSDTIDLENGRRYWVKLAMDDGTHIRETQAMTVVPTPNVFNWSQTNNFLLLVLFTVAVLVSIGSARKNPHQFLRRIGGLAAVEDAIGRATEMGKPILYLTGSDPMSSPSTIAATVILGEVAKKVSMYETGLIVPHRDPIVLAICQEITKEAYTQTGHPDAYSPEMNFYITDDQFSYTAAVQGIMLRDRPAAIFLLGYYYAESLLLAETGHEAGAIQIAGTDADHQLPFFVIACDYTLMGEELYAASAYLSREPVLVGTLRGQDIGKAVLLGALTIGAALVTTGDLLQTEIFSYAVELFHDFK